MNQYQKLSLILKLVTSVAGVGPKKWTKAELDSLVPEGHDSDHVLDTVQEHADKYALSTHKGSDGTFIFTCGDKPTLRSDTRKEEPRAPRRARGTAPPQKVSAQRISHIVATKAFQFRFEDGSVLDVPQGVSVAVVQQG